MKKTLLSIAAIASIVSVASADDAWFNGGINGETLSGGVWDQNVEGVTTTDPSKIGLDDVAEFKFTADESKSVSGSANLNFTSSVKFQYAYDELPAIGATDKAGVIAFGEESPTYYVLAKDADSNPATNKWTNTGISATLDTAVAVNVVISNGQNSAVFAIYKIGEAAAKTYEIVAADSFRIVDYSGSGEINTLIGQLIAMGIIVPGYNDPIPQGQQLDAWLAANNLTVDQLKTDPQQANGNTAYQNCVLGINGNEKLITKAEDASESKLTLGIDSTPMSGVSIQYKLMKKAPAATESTQVGKASASPFFEPDIADGIYQITAQIGNKEIQSEKVGAMQVNSTKTTEYIAVPWTDFGGATGIAPTALVKATGLSVDDTLEVYDAANGDWEGYRWTGTEWTSTTENPNVTTLTRGMAVKLTRSNTENSVYLVGGAPDGAVETTLQNNKWNLVANPGFGEFSIGSTKLGASTKDAVMVAGESVFTQYTCRNGEWAKIVPVVENGIQTNTRVQENMTVPQGTGFFFVNESGKGAINW